MTSNSRSNTIPQEEWEKYRTEITSLFQDLTYAQIIDHLGTKYNFRPSRYQFGNQVQKQWKLQKNFKRKLQVNAHAKLKEREGRPTEVLIENRLIPEKKLRKTATAMATAQKRKLGGYANVGSVQKQSYRPKRPKQITMGPNDIAGEENVSCPATPDNIIVRTPPALEVPIASPVPSPSSLMGAHHSQMPIALFNDLFENNVLWLAEMLAVPSLDTSDPHGSVASQLHYSEDFRRINPRDIELFLGTDVYPSEQKLANQAPSGLQRIIIERAQEGFIEHIKESPSLSKFAAPFRILRYMVYLASNNLLPTSAISELLLWVSTRGYLWIVEVLMDSQLPSIAIFASLLFNCAVDVGDTDIVTALLAKGVDPNSRAPDDFYWRTSTLQVAIKNSDAAMVRVLLSFGAKVSNTTVANSSAGRYPMKTDLDIASRGSRLCSTTIQLLLQHGANVNVPIPAERGSTSVLNRVLELNEMEVAKKLVSAGALVNDHQCGQSVTALQTAARYCDGEIVKLLIEAGADVNIPIGPEYDLAQKVAKRTGAHEFFITPLLPAIERNDIAMAKVLLDNHASVDGFDFYEFFPTGYSLHRAFDDTFCCSFLENNSDSDPPTHCPYLEDEYYPGCDGDISFLKEQMPLYSPLQRAAANKSQEMIHLLLEHHPTINMMGGVGTALQVACMQRGNMEVVKLLIDKGANINSPAQDRYGQTALQAAILSGDTQVIEYLLDKKADVRAPASLHFGQTALQAAAKMGFTRLASELIERGADVNEATSTQNETCLHLAARSGNVELVCLLLKHGADVNAPPTASYWGHTVLLEAVVSGKHEIVEKVLANGGDLSTDDKKGIEYGYVGAAIEHCNRETVELLLQRGACPNKTHCGRTPLHLAVIRGSLDLVQLMLNRGGDPNEKDCSSWSAFTWAIFEQDENLVRILINGGANVNPQEDDLERAPLVVAIRTGNFSIIGILLAAKANIHGPAGLQGLMAAIDDDRTDLVQLLLSLGLRADHLKVDKHICQRPLTRAIVNQNDAVVNMLLAHDADFYLRDGAALVWAVRNGDLPLIRRLLSLQLALDVQRTYAEALVEAASSRQVGIAEALMAAGADVNGQSDGSFRNTIFNSAINSGSLAMVRLFIQSGAHINPSSAGRDTLTPLQCAARKGNAAIVNLLLSNGADVNAPSAKKFGRTALGAAAENGRLDTVYKMLKYDKEPQTLEQRIKSAARLATWNGFPLVAKYLEEWQQNRSAQAMS